MDLNSINCGGYRVEKSAVTFSLTDTTVEEVSALNKQKLTLTININQNNKHIKEK